MSSLHVDLDELKMGGWDADEVLSRADDAMYADKAEAGAPTRHLRSVE